jgi:formylglycine-generating enzyme required for sulfatase activity
MVVLPPGRYDRGAPYVDADPPPRYTPPETVVIERAFAIGRYPVTVGEYAAFVRDTSRADVGNCRTDREKIAPGFDPAGSWTDPAFAQTDRHPVVCVHLEDAQAYAAWLSKKTGHVYRLPSDREWEYAAKGGATKRDYYKGDQDEDICKYANVADRNYVAAYPGNSFEPCDDGYLHTSPVGSFPPNEFGLFDMIGNVYQWTSTPRNGGVQLAGGGAWSSRGYNATASDHQAWQANWRTNWIGFRVLREL